MSVITPLIVTIQSNNISSLLNIRKRLDETTAALTTMSKALEIEKKKTDDLLHEMLPTKVATELLAGRTVDAGLIFNLYCLIRGKTFKKN